MNVPYECARAIDRLHYAIEQRCALEQVNTHKQAEAARRSLGQFVRYHIKGK